MKKFIVITTINQPTPAIHAFSGLPDWEVVLVGDRKSADISSADNVTFLSVEQQLTLPFEFPSRCPFDHYSRKNIGYLYAMSQGADVIYDTDDDNIPYDDWHLPGSSARTRVVGPGKYVNVYAHFTDMKVWPRGFPLDEVRTSWSCSVECVNQELLVGVWQGLADRDPDVDAIYRLLDGAEVVFDRRDPIALGAGVYSPFNSQNTFWRKELFPLLYLPATTSFRFTDILRGYVAQPLMWQLGLHLGFLHATVYQERNAHDLMRDFAQEFECYTGVKDVVSLFESQALSGDLVSDLMAGYRLLAESGFVRDDEIELCAAWLSDIDTARRLAREVE